MVIGGTLLAVLLLATSEDTTVSASINHNPPPVLDLTQQNGQVPLCRFGVDATDDISSYDIAPLRLGWYVNWTASSSPPRPNGIQYVPTIRLTQVGTDSYTYAPSGIELQQAITNTPGADWLIGNEPDRPGPHQSPPAVVEVARRAGRVAGG